MLLFYQLPLYVTDFTASDVRRIVNHRTFARGMDYFKRGRVLEIQQQKTGRTFLASVQGSAGYIYQVTLAADGPRLYSSCTCPVGFNCKHGVATALQLLSQQAPPVDPTTHNTVEQTGSWQDWLGQMPDDPSGQLPTLHSGRHYLLYILTEKLGDLRLVIYKAYLKRNGEWSQIDSYIPDGTHLSWNRPGFLQDEDVQILELLPRALSFNPAKIEGERGAVALSMLINTGRLYFRDQPVEIGLRRSLTWIWTESESEDGQKSSYQLVPALDCAYGPEAGWLLFDTSPPWYLDLTKAQAGQAQTPLTGDQVRHMREMPPVPNRDITPVALHLRGRFSKDQLPLPVEPKVTKVTECVAHITLTMRDGGGLSLPGLELRFSYDGFLLDPAESPHVISASDPLILRERDDACFQIQRNAEAEQRVSQHLRELGLAPAQQPPGDLPLVWMPEARSAEQCVTAWMHFQDYELPKLVEMGWIVQVPDSFQLDIGSASFEIELNDAPGNWFDFSLSLPLNEQQRLDTAQVVGHWLEQGAPEKMMLYVAGQWIEVDTRQLKRIRGLVLDLFSRDGLGQPVRLPPFQLGQFQSVQDLDLRHSPATAKLLKELKNFSGIKPVKPPSGLRATLRDYQQSGLNWLAFLQRYRLGGILADDMGLGKTVQVLALILLMKNRKQLTAPALIVVPTSLTGNWLQEAARFTPKLRSRLIHGPDRAAEFDQIPDSDLVVTTYPLLIRDLDRYADHRFSLMVLDEAQAIKNPRTKISACARAINADTRLCLTGTPLENHLGELWALLDFALPGLLAGRAQFNQAYRNPIEKQANTAVQQELASKIGPFLIRRTKGEVATELPEKTEIVQYVELGGKQRALYESIRISMEKRIRDLVALQGMARSQIQFLDALLKLRQACIDPRLVKLKQAATIKDSAKLDWLAESIPQLIEEGRRLLVFSQFTQALKLVEEQLQASGQPYSKLTGQTRNRQLAIDCFQNGEVPIFLISLKAGGSGLNLTEADVVIHIDPWWNPAVENQATDRAHRIGQTKPVFVYKLVAAGTVEERIMKMQQDKQELADSLFDATRSVDAPRSGDDLLALLAD